MQDINEAYEVLSSAEKRAKYDQLGERWKDGPPPPPEGESVRSSGPRGAGAEGFSDFFRDWFRQEEGDGEPQGVPRRSSTSRPSWSYPWPKR